MAESQRLKGESQIGEASRISIPEHIGALGGFHFFNLTSHFCLSLFLIDSVVNDHFNPSSIPVISDCACWLPVRRAAEIPSTSMRFASSIREALASVCAAMK